MRASAPFQVTIRSFGYWRAAVACLLAASAGSMIAFAMAHGESAPAAWRLTGLALSIAIVLGGAGLLRCPPMSLRWDGQCWHLGPAASAGEEPASGRVVVCLDLGAWMLLRFEHEVTVRGAHIRWLPVQRRGMEAHWHALRCAVYSSRPAHGPVGGQTPARSPQSQE
jgi:hypothetical protein